MRRLGPSLLAVSLTAFLSATASHAQSTRTHHVRDAIRNGEVDALIVSSKTGNKVYTLAGAEHPYRVIVEAMGEGAVIVASDGAISYSNRSFAAVVSM